MERRRPPQKLPDPKLMRKQIMAQYKRAEILLAEALREAKDMLETKDYGLYNHDVNAVVNLAVVLFQLSMSKEQGLMKAQQIEEAIKQQKKQKRTPANSRKVEGMGAPFEH